MYIIDGLVIIPQFDIEYYTLVAMILKLGNISLKLTNLAYSLVFRRTVAIRNA